MSKLINAVIGILTVLYPFAVYIGVQYFQPWAIAVVLLGLLLIRSVMLRKDKKWNRLLLLISIVYCILAIWNNNLITLRFYPVLINLGLFSLFLSSLFFPPPVIERLARLQHPNLPEQGVIYTRKVTQVWCAFFMINAMIAVITAVWGSFALWSLYNGLIAYLLMGLLMGIEYLVRIRTQPHVR